MSKITTIGPFFCKDSTWVLVDNDQIKFCSDELNKLFLDISEDDILWFNFYDKKNEYTYEANLHLYSREDNFEFIVWDENQNEFCLSLPKIKKTFLLYGFAQAGGDLHMSCKIKD